MKKIIQIISQEGQLIGLGDNGRLYRLTTTELFIEGISIPYLFENVWVELSEGHFLQDEIDDIKASNKR